jgi:hypothetical protein
MIANWRSTSDCVTGRMAASLPAAATIGLAMLSAPAVAQQPASAASATTPAATNAPLTATAAAQESVTEELIRLLAEHNALSKIDAQALIRRLQTQQVQAAGDGAKTAPQAAAPVAASVPPAPAASAAATSTAPPPAAGSEKSGTVRVIYIPESEKQKIREQVKEEVIAQAKAENWAQPYAIPEWVKRIKLDGDFRFRQEFDYLASDNDPQSINFQAINSGPPIDLNPPSGPFVFPYLNTTQNRELPRIRARFGLSALVARDLTGEFRFATGNTTNPVSTNQTLGTDFNKTSFVIDRAALDYQPLDGLDLYAGRMASPWQSTEMLFDDDLNFDGVAGHYRVHIGDTLTPFVTLGAFSVENTAFDFPSTNSSKVGSRDKWLFAVQLGSKWKLSDGMNLKSAVAFYDFYHLEGKLSSQDCAPLNSSISCNTDDSRPAFLQKGNTLFAIRNLEGFVTQNPTASQLQYFGLASPFRILDATFEFDDVLKGPVHLVFTGDFADNLAYNSDRVLAKVPANNYDPAVIDPSTNNVLVPERYHGGSYAYLAQLLVGQRKLAELGDWNTLVGYRHIESDAVVDAFTDSDFHLGGTNAKGYYVGGGFAFTHNAWVSARWLSATEVTGPPMSIDVLQLDLNARF